MYVGSSDLSEELLKHPLGEYNFLGQFNAITSYAEGWIEAGISQVDNSMPRQVFRRRLFGSTEPNNINQIAINSEGPMRIYLTEESKILQRIEDQGSRLFLKIEGVDTSQHDLALNTLKEVANSLFIHIDFKFELPLGLVRSRPLRRRRSNALGLKGEGVNLPKVNGVCARNYFKGEGFTFRHTWSHPCPTDPLF